MESSWDVIVSGLVGILLGVLVIILIAYVASIRDDRKKDREDPLAMYCPGCGNALVTMAQQIGYDQKTGKAEYKNERRCAKAGAYNRYCEYGLGHHGSLTYVDPPHTHDDPKAKGPCLACLDQMAKDGVVQYDTLEPLYRKALTSKRN